MMMKSSLSSSDGGGPMGWNSIDGLSSVMRTANWVIAASVLVTFVCTVVVIVADKKRESLTREADLAKEHEIALINQSASDANARAAEANRIAEQERLARLRIEERLAWRRVSPKEHSAIVAALKQYAGTRVYVVKLGDPEAGVFADDLMKTLTDSKWAVAERDMGTVVPTPYGLQCRIDETTPAGKSLAKALSSLPTAQIVPVSGSDALLIVGLRPQP